MLVPDTIDGDIIMALRPRQEAIADAVLSGLKETFGWSVYDLLIKKITQNYLNNKIDIRTAIVEHPAVFERAFIGLIGPLGEKFLADVCEKVQSELDLDHYATYSRVGDFAKYIMIASHA
ncbi:hypothetical protein NTE_02259 [Candidatus Nitrososphaera evergladensis SR1]|uniref:Nitrososphaera output domain-containing protein n=1 Tax=Candidatus Nitrososphaera evergladensis SR1 TaxID=1459636 RepID=A0A075MT68_9ARCH|nr:hypothetical protein [Candidatus Nitrososphaera evergladensis]AIF84313.1 hypothetical protein NTE_02259 [Candidatus Nitrososphaera evergladensis SR1]